jgi:sterol 14-demethylase
VSKLYNDLDQGIMPISVFFPNAPLPAHFKRNKARKEMVKLFSKASGPRGDRQAARRTDHQHPNTLWTIDR